MTKLAFDPNVMRTADAASPAPDTSPSAPRKDGEASRFTTEGSNRWKAMTKSTETPSVIGDMIDGASENTYNPTDRDIEQAYLGDMMCGDDGNIRVADWSNVSVEDHEYVEIPDTKKLFEEYPSLQKNTYSILERLTLLRTTVTELIELNTETLNSRRLSHTEAEGIKDYLNYLYDCMHQIQTELDVVDYYRQQELYERRLAMEEND